MSAIIGCGTITGQPNAEDYCLTSPIGFRCELQVVSANRELLVTVREAVGMGNRQGESYESFRVDVEQSHRVSEVTIAYYDRMAEAYWDGTRDHDVSQNYTAFLDAIENDPPYSILDLGCGPGRDLHHFRLLGHNAVGLDGSTEFVAMARSYSGCEVLHQDFLTMILPESRFDGVFANASLFHVPSRELPRVLLELSETLRPRGVLFCSNPRGNNEEGFGDGRYSCFFDLDTWRNYVRAAGFFEVGHYYRPPGLPRHQQPWLATVWRKG